ncbi:hypothetical protein ACI65C_003923 [Semiaphis heraclei]
MKSLAAVMTINIFLCGAFTLTNGLTCYKCDLDDKKCATESSDSNLIKINCSEAPAAAGGVTTAPAGDTTAAPAGDAAETTAAPAEEPAPAMFRRRRSNGTLDMYNNTKSFIQSASPIYFCYKANVKASTSAEPTVVRGCKTTSDDKDCVKVSGGAIVESCSVCDKDNCNGNGQSIVTGSEVQCALMSSLVIAWMFLQTK